MREEVLRAVLKADLIGFHTYDYARHFVSACTRILGLEVGRMLTVTLSFFWNNNACRSRMGYGSGCMLAVCVSSCDPVTAGSTQIMQLEQVGISPQSGYEDSSKLGCALSLRQSPNCVM